jgi:DNA modification methylase
MKIKMNTVVCGDNLEWLKDLEDESVDLCYIDPPFFSNRNYEIIWGNGYELRSFGDRFSGGISHYIEWMRPRINLIHKKLKKSGSIFLHCDYHAAHRLRCILEDSFGESGFINEIYWKRQSAHSDARKKFADIVDVIHFFSKGVPKFKPAYTAHDPSYVKNFYRHDDNDGRGPYQLDNMASPNPRPNMMYDWNGFSFPEKGWRYQRETMQKLHNEARIYYPSKPDGKFDISKRPRLKRYLREQKGQIISNLWDDIQSLHHHDKERLGYPTQKPEALVKRIIEMCSEPGDIILDCFAGGGTTAKVAAELGRRFIVGDVSPVAVRIMAERLNFDCPNTKYEIKNLPQTVDEFKLLEGHKFAQMVCELKGWKVNERRSNDGGIDGWDAENNPIQVKNHAESAAGRPDMQKFLGAIMREKKKRGVFVAWEFARTAKEFVAEIKREHGVEIILVPCSDVFGDLVIPHDKETEIEKLYKERYPENWNARSTARRAA